MPHFTLPECCNIATLNECLLFAKLLLKINTNNILENQQIVLIVVFTTDISKATGKDLIF